MEGLEPRPTVKPGGAVSGLRVGLGSEKELFGC